MNSLIRAPPQPAPLSKSDAYTTWPGGVDPTVKLYNVGGKRKASRSSRSSRKNRKASRSSRKNRKASRSNRKH